MVKVPDEITAGSIERIVVGSRSMYILSFITENIDNGDTVDVSGLISNCDGCWFQPSNGGQTEAPAIARSSTGNTTLTFTTTVANMNGLLFIIGTP